jgi:cell wall-associated NlpC family hydrolase
MCRRQKEHSQVDNAQAIIAEGKTWLGTPYHYGARIKGAGADCATFIAQVCITLGLIPDIDIPRESAAHFLKTANPIYLETVLRFCTEITEAEIQPGDLVMYKKPKWPIFTHGAIVVDWPNAVLHAVQKHGVVMTHGIQGEFRGWERKYFRLK